MSRRKEILNQLDQCNDDFTFPMLDHGYVYLAGTKLTAYRDDNRWIIVIEIIGFNYRGGGHNGISNCLHIYGNCLNYMPGIQNENFLYLTNDVNDCNTFDEEEYFYLNPECSSFTLRGEILPVVHDKKVYESSGIEIEDKTRINAYEFLRLLEELHHDKLAATDSEIRQRIPNNIPEIIKLRNWYHPDIANGELPSGNETFQQIAKVLETGNVEYYQPAHKPNTNWKNWPDGGTL